MSKMPTSLPPNLGLLGRKAELAQASLKTLVIILFFLPLFACGAVWACSFDVDCEAGSKCIKNSSGIDGVCMGGLFPGNKNDRQPVYDPLDVNGTVGNTCSFSVDCGPGNYCAKAPSAVDGVCVRAR
jgi:hypothetical protein